MSDNIPTPPTNPVQVNVTSTGGTLVPLPSFGVANNGIQTRQALDMQVSEAGMLSITVQHARTAMRNKLSALQTRLAELAAEHTKLTTSITDSFKNWTRDQSATLSSFYASFTTPANTFLPGTPEITFPRLPRLNWDTGTASATFTYSYSQSARSVEDDTNSVAITVCKSLSLPIPSDVLAIKADLDRVTSELATCNADITKTRRALGNTAELQEIARSQIASKMLDQTGNGQLVTQLRASAEENVDGIINALV